MGSLSTGPVADVLARLYKEAEVVDAPMRAGGRTASDVAASLIASEAADLRGTYHNFADNFFCVSPKFGRHLYMCARAARARLVVEFGASMGVSTIFAAAALRDAGGAPGARVVTTELEESKARRARDNVAAAGLADLVDVRVGDARETLRAGLDGEQVDVLLLDGAWSLYTEVLKLVEPHLRPGAVVLADNAHDPAYLEYVRDPRNGYLSLPLEFGEKDGNEFSVRIR